MKRVPIAAFHIRRIAAAFAAGTAVLILTTATAQNAPPAPAPAAPAPGAPAPGAPGAPAPGAPAQGVPAPGTTAPATTVPATTVPATTVPATTVPATTVPATTVPATTVPATTVPATTVPATTVPVTPTPTPTTVAPASTNPLLLGTTETGNTPTSSFQDYRQAVSVGGLHPLRDGLPTFGFDFFQAARDLVQAHRGKSGPAGAAVNAFDTVSDPLSQLQNNVFASVPPSYQLSGGDSLNVRYWSPRLDTKSANLVVDAAGSISIEGVGLLVVRGLTLDQAEKTIRERIGGFFKGIEVSVTLTKLRTIQVTVTGAAFQPGSYAVPSIATAYNVLYAAGGPLEDGSLRSIEVRRNGKVVGTLDLYNFILVGNRGTDIALESGDLIYIPHRRARIGVAGEVLQPAIFELRANETLKDLLQYAGGVRPSAVAQRVRINTVDPANGRIQKDVDISTAIGSRQPLFDGDDVEILSVRPLLTNTVTIDGAVDQPSTYALTPNMRVSDLVGLARGVISEAYLVRANLYRWNANNTTTLITIDLAKALDHNPAVNIPLQRWDRLTVFNRKEVTWIGQRTINVRGAVMRAGAYTLSDNMRLSDLLLLAGGPMPDAYLDRAMLLHKHGDGTFGLDYVNLAGLTIKDPAKDVLLQDGDTLAVYRTGEAQFEPDHVVTINGEVVAPGPFPRSDGMHLSDLLKLSGGFKPGATPVVSIAHARRVLGGVNVAHNLVQVKFDENHACAKQDDVVMEDGDVVLVQTIGGYVSNVPILHIKGAVNRSGPIVMTSKTMHLSEALAAAGGLRPEAFPSGAEFTRDPALMATDNQRSLTSIIGSLNDLVNTDTFNREKGKSLVERIQAVNAASQPDSTASPLGGQTSQPSTGLTGPLADAITHEEMVSPARKLTDGQMSPSGNIAINLPEALKHPMGVEDILLQEGDTITIPETPTTIQIVGAVVRGRGVMYKQGATLDYYIAQVGGFAPDAAKDRIEVIHMGGGLVPSTKAGKLLPGDVIVVPTRVLAEKIAVHHNAIGDFFKSLTSSAIVFRVATSLFGL